MISDWWMAKNGSGVSGLESGKSGRAKSRPSSFVQDRGPVLGKNLRREARGERSEEREETSAVVRPPSAEKSLETSLIVF